MGKYGRFGAFIRGQVLGLRQGGAGRLEITRLVKKKDGKHPTVRTADNILSKNEDEPSWRGEDSRAGGRPAALSKSEVGALTRLVFREPGKAVVTTRGGVPTAYACRIQIPHVGVHGTIRIVERSEYRAHQTT